MTPPALHNSARDAAVGVIQVLRRAGHVAYLAGGCVRDGLLGVKAKDFDVATSARPEVVRGLFKRSQYVGEAVGVVLVYPRPRSGGKRHSDKDGPTHGVGGLGENNRTGGNPGAGAPGVEVATFRLEWGYEDGRRPGGVSFTDAEHDAQRRDFTVNGLFADPLDEKLEPVAPGCEKVIDFVGGVKDLRAGVLRAIGVAGERFGEDYLRMLRAVRFAARFGFEIEAKTAEAIRAHAVKLSGISRERIGQEVRMMLTPAAAPGAGRGNNVASGSARELGGAVSENQVVVAAGLMQVLGLDGPALGEGCVAGSLLPALLGVTGGLGEGGRVLKHAPPGGGEGDATSRGASWGSVAGGGPPLGERGLLGRDGESGDKQFGGDDLGETPGEALGEAPGQAPGAGVGVGYGLVLAAWMLDRAGASGSLEAAAGFAERKSRGVLRVWRKALCLSNGDRDGVARVMGLLVRAKGWAGLGVAKRKRLLGEAGWGEAMRLVRVVGSKEVVKKIEVESLPLIAEGVSPKRLVNGDDLLGMGVPSGPRVGELLEGVYDEQLEGRVGSKAEGLAWVRGEL